MNSTNLSSSVGPLPDIFLHIWCGTEILLCGVLFILDFCVFVVFICYQTNYANWLSMLCCYFAGYGYALCKIIYVALIAGNYWAQVQMEPGTCFVLVNVQLYFFVIFYWSTVIVFIFATYSLHYPWYTGKRHVWFCFATLWIVASSLYILPMYGWLRKDREDAVFWWYDCNWNIFSLWYLRLSLYGVITTAYLAGISVAIKSLLLARKQANTIATQAKSVRKDEDSRKKQNQRIGAVRVYFICWILIPVWLFTERSLTAMHPFGTLVSFTCFDINLIVCSIVVMRGPVYKACLKKLKADCASMCNVL